MPQHIQILETEKAVNDSLFTMVQEVVSLYEIDAVIEKVTDATHIQEYRLMSTPALVVDKFVVLNGRIPSAEEILEFLS